MTDKRQSQDEQNIQNWENELIQEKLKLTYVSNAKREIEKQRLMNEILKKNYPGITLGNKSSEQLKKEKDLEEEEKKINIQIKYLERQIGLVIGKQKQEQHQEQIALGKKRALESLEYDISKKRVLERENYNNSRQTPDRHRSNYITTNRFYVEIESQLRASFTECSGLGVNIKKESYFEGGVNDQQRIFLGQAEFTDVTLKRGMTDDFTFWGWITQVLSGLPEIRRNVNILLFNQAGQTMQCWTLIGAIPISWKSPGLQADGNNVAIEELTLAYEGLKVNFDLKGSGGASVNLSRDRLGFFPSN
jgi:phage tail-like protein